MGKVMVARLGMVEFSVSAGTFTDFARATRWRIDIPEPIEGLGAPKSRGLESDEITLHGISFPGFSGTLDAVQRLRDLGDSGKSQILVDGEGTIYGFWMVKSVNERKGPFTPTGVERRAEWDLTLVADPDGDLIPI